MNNDRIFSQISLNFNRPYQNLIKINDTDKKSQSHSLIYSLPEYRNSITNLAIGSILTQITQKPNKTTQLLNKPHKTTKKYNYLIDNMEDQQGNQNKLNRVYQKQIPKYHRKAEQVAQNRSINKYVQKNQQVNKDKVQQIRKQRFNKHLKQQSLEILAFTQITLPRKNEQSPVKLMMNQLNAETHRSQAVLSNTIKKTKKHKSKQKIKKPVNKKCISSTKFIPSTKCISSTNIIPVTKSLSVKKSIPVTQIMPVTQMMCVPQISMPKMTPVAKGVKKPENHLQRYPLSQPFRKYQMTPTFPCAIDRLSSKLDLYIKANIK